MDRATQLALNAINQRFYATRAGEFSSTRRRPWPGFTRVLDWLWQRSRAAAEPADQMLRVLDVGAGDGRFAALLNDSWRARVRYLGVDSSIELLAAAQARALGADFAFAQADFVTTPPSAALPPGSFDLIALFGVLHHVPGHELRCELLRELAARVAPSGILALTFWRLPEDPRFSTRLVRLPIDDLPGGVALSPERLEPGDTLLRWGAGNSAPRYCHFPSEHEAEQLLASTGLSVVHHFRADGRGNRLNEYLLLAAQG